MQPQLLRNAESGEVANLIFPIQTHSGYPTQGPSYMLALPLRIAEALNRVEELDLAKRLTLVDQVIWPFRRPPPPHRIARVPDRAPKPVVSRPERCLRLVR